MRSEEKENVPAEVPYVIFPRSNMKRGEKGELSILGSCTKRPEGG